MNSLVQKYATLGIANISTANPDLNGQGELGRLLDTAQASQGVSVSSIVVKATGDTSEGMVRIFVGSAQGTQLYKEIYVPATTQSSVTPAFQSVLYLKLVMDPGQTLYVSTQNNDSFNVLANGYSWINCPPSEKCTCDSPLAVAQTGLANISIANPYLDGSGAIANVFTATAAGQLAAGALVGNIDVKATTSTDQGMVRLFLTTPNGATNYLFWEIPIPATTQSAVASAYRTRAIAGLFLAPGYSIGASTQNANPFNIIAFGADVANCQCS